MATDNLGSVVVAVDGSEESMNVLRWALDNLRLRPDGELVVLHVHPPPNIAAGLNPAPIPVGGPSGVEVPAFTQAIEAHQRRITQANLDALKICSEKNVEVKTEVVVGDPKEKICEVAANRKADLLVVGCRAIGLGPLKRMDPRQSNVGEGSQGFVPSGNNGAYQPPWNPFTYGYQAPSGWFSQGFQPIAPHVPMMNSSSYAPQGFQPAQIPEVSKHNSEADVEEVAVPPARTDKRRIKTSVTRTKLSNFDRNEDVNLVKSWLEISCDPSTGQKRDRMWDRIIRRYNLRRGYYPERSVRSLQSRWDIIKAQVGLFASYYADSIRENPSGMSDACKITHAVDNFASVLKRKFGFLHCWELMKDEPKWQDPHLRDIATAARGEGFGDESTQGTDTVDNVEGQSSPVQSGAEARRPMGRDSAKAAKKKANSDAGSTSSAARMQELSLQKISIMQDEAVPLARTGKRRIKTSVTRTKLGNFNADEDVNVVKSWLEICCDPITSTGQKRDRMWDRIIRQYNLRRGSNPERSVRSLQSRWDTIKAEVGLFVPYYADSIRENPSGMSNACKTTRAVGNFASVLKRKFGFLHCWELMKDEPKWQDPHLRELMKDEPKWQDAHLRDIATAAQGEGFGDESTQGTDTMDNVEGQSSPVRSGAEARRPMGRDSAKAAKKKANSDAGSTSSAARMQELSLQKNSIMQDEAVRKK